MPQHIMVVDYDPKWPGQARAEAERIRAVLGENCSAVYHIGSTAVPGLAAKPILDLMPVVTSLAEADRAASAFAGLGYEYLGEFGIPGRRYLRKGGDERTHQVHIFEQTDGENINRHLAVRDYLRTHKGMREEYASLKRALARRFPYDIEGYCRGKEAFVQDLERKALADWRPHGKEGDGMRRAEREVRNLAQREEILRECRVVHIGARDEAGPFVVPMNYGYRLEGEVLTLYLHGAREGRKAAAFRRGGSVAFEMDCEHALCPADTACAYSYAYRSLMGTGEIREVTDPAEKRAGLQMIMAHMTGQDSWELPEAALERTAVFALAVREWTGKQNQMSSV